MDERNPELMECPFCGSKGVYTDTNIGSDIYVTKNEDVIEESQHRDVCPECNAWRFRFERISMKDGSLPIVVGKWEENDTELTNWMGW